MATGHGNQLTDDVELDLRDTDGPVDVAIGDRNAQQAVEDDSTRTEDSFNRDASTDGSHNATVEDSFDTTTSDDDTTSTTVEGSMNHEALENDTTMGTASETVASREAVMDGDTATFDWEGHGAESTALADDDQLHSSPRRSRRPRQLGRPGRRVRRRRPLTASIGPAPPAGTR